MPLITTGPLTTIGSILTLTPLSGFASLQLVPYSARGLTQTLELIKPSGDAWTRRDVNGIKRSLVDTRFRKYKSTITCRDGVTPCLDDAWIGETVEVACVIELSYPTGATPGRPSVEHSERTEETVTFYRPLLQMMVEDIRISLPEWQGAYDWQIDLEEI
jgi:hypothetical protein